MTTESLFLLYENIKEIGKYTSVMETNMKGVEHHNEKLNSFLREIYKNWESIAYYVNKINESIKNPEIEHEIEKIAQETAVGKVEAELHTIKSELRKTVEHFNVVKVELAVLGNGIKEMIDKKEEK